MAPKRSIFETDLPQTAANFAALTPLGFLFRAAAVYPTKTAIVHGQTRISYARFAARVRCFAHALVKRGLKQGQTVAILAPNIPAMLEAHYAVPLAGGVLNALNYRLDAATIAFILDHGEAKFVLQARGRVCRRSITNRFWPRAHPTMRAAGLPTNGRRFACSTRRARPAIPRASCTIIAALS